ncbi:type II toxin-antitoxin system VapC family toxin [Patescibacteria group bacterium]|nr:MAG: type II toxin-antitoxin system VapC family toxin [Patescibacteria group bacterium]
MILLDTNVFIYLANGTLDPKLIAKTDIAHSSITEIEALGYGAIPANELLLLQSLFDESYGIELSQPVVETAIRLRQAKPMSLGDAIVAASAQVNNLPLWTANTDDFRHIEGLQLVNPLKLS